MLKQLDTLIGFAVVMSVVSMLIMVATQAVSSFLALRGKNLRDGLEALFTTLVADLPSDQARALAEVILKRPIISDTSLRLKGWMPELWKLASAIRPEECLLAIRRIDVLTPQEVKRPLSEKAQAGDTVANAQTAARRVLNALRDLAARAAVAAAPVPQAAPNPAAPNPAPPNPIAPNPIAPNAAGPNSEAQIWADRFQTVQDRANQWFTMHTRQVTVMLAFVAAFVLQLNAFDLYTRLANDPALRSEVVKFSPAIQTRVNDAINAKFSGTVYSAALEDLKNRNEISTLPTGGEAETASGARQWLVSQNVKGEVLNDYDKTVNAKAGQRVQDAKEEINEVMGVYDQSSLRLIPDPYPVKFDGTKRFWENVDAFLGFSGWRPGKAFGGMLATAMLLTLGAPFWFNLLKSLSSLRSSVSEQIDKDKEGKPPLAKPA